MPLITQEQADQETPVVPAPVVPAAAPKPAPGALETAAAAFQKSNILGSLYERAATMGPQAPAQPGYDPYANEGRDIRGYDPLRFVDAESPEEVQAIKNQIASEQDADDTLARAGVWGHVANLAAGAVDPMTLTLMLLPGVGEASAGTRIAAAVGTNVAGGEAQQAALSATQETGSYTEGMIPRIAANALLAGVLGTMASRIPKEEFEAAAAQVKEGLEKPPGSTAGAMAVPQTTLEDESIAPGGKAIAKTLGRVSVSDRIMTDSKVPEARRLAQQLVDVAPILNKNLKGEPTLPNLETQNAAQENFRDFQFIQKFDQEYAAYKAKGGELSKYDFGKEVRWAMSANDAHEIEEVRNVATFLRPMFDGDREVLSSLGAMKEGKDVVGAPSYFPRVYDQNWIAAHQIEAEQRIRDWFRDNPRMEPAKEVKEGEAAEPPVPEFREPAEIEYAVRETIDHMMSMPRHMADIGQQVTPKPLKTRVLDIPDTVLGPMLSSDLEHIARGYTRAVVPQINLRRMFPDGIEAEFQNVSDAYKIKQTEATTNAAKEELSAQQAADLRNLKILYDRALHLNGPRGNESVAIVRGLQMARAYNYTRVLGGQLLSAFPDLPRLVTRYGFLNTAHRLTQFLTGLDKGMMKQQAQRLATGLDVVLHTRQHTLDGLGDELAGSELRNKMGNITARFTKMTGIAHWDAMMRILSATQEQDAIFRAITKDKISQFETAKLASHGIGTADLPAIREQWQKYGLKDRGLNFAQTELWDNRAAAEKIEQAVQKAASSTAFYVGKGDLPGFADNQVGKLMFQFKAFVMSSVNRLVIPLAQGLAHKDVMAANGLISLLAMGAVSYYTHELAAGRKPDLSPGALIPNAVNRSGILAYAPDVYDPVAGMFHLPRFSKFKDLNPLETAGGATFGAAASTLETLTRLTRGNISASDLHRVRQLIPYNNVFYFNRLVNMAEGETADALNLKGASDKPALDYLNPSKDEESKIHQDKEHLFGLEQIPNAF